MKNIYIIILSILFLIFLTFLLLLPKIQENLCVGVAIQALSAIAALVAAVIALSVADPKCKYVNIKIEKSLGNNSKEYDKNELSSNLKDFYKNSPNIFKSDRIYFKITNISGFTLKKPNLTFRLPINKKHPVKSPKLYESLRDLYDRVSFNSNLYNSQVELQTLEMGETVILSNSNLPYWNNKESIVIWIRMIVEDSPFNISLAVNCDNAEGVTKEVTIQITKQ